MRRKTIIVMALALVLAMLVGCTGGGTVASTTAPSGVAPTSGTAPTSAPATQLPAESSNINPIGTLPIVKDKITLSVLQYIRDTDATTMEGLWWAEKLEGDTNIHIDWTQVNQSDWNTQVNLMFASGEYTDIIVNGGTIDAEIYGVDQGILLPVDDLIDAYMPVYKERLEGDTSAWKSLIRTDGKMYAIGRIADDGTNHPGSFFINKKWLDEASLPLPTTAEELYEALKAFVTADPNRLGYTGTFDEFTTYFFHLWGISENNLHVSLDENKQVVFNPFQPGYREAIEYMHRLYSEGLMDINTITQDANTKISKYNQNNVGLTTMHRIKSMGWDILEEDMVFLLPPAAEGYSVNFRAQFAVASQRVFFTATNAYLQESAMWTDYQLQDQPTFESYYGPEGVLWNWNDAGQCELGPEGDQGVMQYAMGVNGICYLPGYYYNTVFLQPDYRVERIEYSALYKEKGLLEPYAYTYLNNLAVFTPDSQAERNQIFANLEPLYDEAVAEMIMHGPSDDRWNTFISNLEGAGAARFVELYQEGVNPVLP
ncbi:MAG: extracellular solute-binding protein [Christensenellales bacterium]|jgi:putative aldouronate transport system substrate-binding protein